MQKVEAQRGFEHVFTVYTPERFLAEARASEERYRKGRPLGSLDGIPVGLKDLYYTRDMATTAGSKILAAFRPERDAEAVRRLRAEGANLALGKLNLHEFAYGPTGASSYFGPVPNPWDPGRIAGGSSSGSAFAVARGWVAVGLGTDTGGSVRIPAALSGVVGLKPSYGSVPMEGVIPLAWTLDHAGPLARSTADVAEIFRVIAEKRSQIAAPRPFRVLRPRNWGRAYDPAIDEKVGEALRILGAAQEVRVEEGELPLLDEMMAAHYLILSAEAATFHWAWLRDCSDAYQEDVRTRLLERAAVPAVAYLEALRVRRRAMARYRDVFRDIDLIALPSVPITAPRLDAATVMRPDGAVEDVRDTLTAFTAPFNLLGLPALSQPCGLVGGLPVGIQWVAPAGRDAWLLEMAAVYERVSGWKADLPAEIPGQG